MCSKICVITGQTATGKTKFAIEHALKNNGELVNADSRQVYKLLDIVTGKDLSLTGSKFYKKFELENFELGYYELGRTKIWLYDIIEPDYEFSAFDFKKCAELVIDDVLKRNKFPIIVGGSYFYLKSLLYKTINLSAPPNPKLRAKLNTKTVSELKKMLAKMNYGIYSKMNNSDRNNPHRLIRKIEIATTKIHKKADEVKSKYEFDIKGFAFESKGSLKQEISKRVDHRLRLGATAESEKLLSIGYTKDCPGLKTIGYKQIMDFLEGNISKEQLIEDWIIAEVQYAKRQLSFMKQNQNIRWTFI